MFVAYKRARNALNKLIKDTKRNYYTSVLNDTKNNPKNMWNTINKLTNKKSKTTTITKLKIQIRYHTLLIPISRQLEKI
jgi:hypothetical protein